MTDKASVMVGQAGCKSPAQARYELFELLTKQRGPWCERCGQRAATEMHHAIIRRNKRRPEFDCEENLELVCRICHGSGELDTYTHSCEFWLRQINRGYDMAAWHRGLNLKTREYYD